MRMPAGQDLHTPCVETEQLSVGSMLTMFGLHLLRHGTQIALEWGGNYIICSLRKATRPTLSEVEGRHGTENAG